MSSKINQFIAAKRQIPEHIRNTYPVFVEFVQLYYKFLQETQAQNLESIRDIDTTLDEFINSFKNELAQNLPIDLVNDKRFILKHLREFYLSRGSEASYKFLFRTLFNKEAEIFYPSTQILRVSDGKWTQDVSIFVTSTNEDIDVFGIFGKYITITNTQGKRIKTFVKSVVAYSDTIAEVFIERDYINEIQEGATVFCADNSFNGIILPCPSKVSIYKSGKGFKIGSLYALKTQLGRGCVIKVTKVNSEGGITAVSVIKFGLDYKTKFWSYLSSKDLTNIEYVHPARLNHPYNPTEPAYNERSGGFIDYGWASKQTYFYYDQDIPVATPDKASDRFFANPDYVGDVQQQFYTDNTSNPLDEDLAIIQIDIGGVAKYPGYYMKVDGFVSDEVYIQDGEYYQAFSYVIKVEEELRKYADIIKALVHPAGMKMFAEYNIFNQIDVTATTSKLFNILQLPLSDHPPSEAITDDRGFSYNAYITTLINGLVETYPAEGASKVFARQGKASLLVDKLVSDFVTDVNICAKQAIKNLVDAVTDIDDAESKLVYKPIIDVIVEYLETEVKEITKNINENVLQPETNSKFFETIKTDIQLIVDTQSKLVDKPVADVLNTIVDLNIKTIFKNMIEDIINVESISKAYAKPLDDQYSAIDVLSNNLFKVRNDAYSISDINLTNFIKNSYDSVNGLDEHLRDIAKGILTNQLIDDAIASFLQKPFADNLSQLLDSISNSFQTSFTDSASISDIIQIIRGLVIEELVSVIDQYVVTDYNKALLEDIFANQNMSKLTTKIYDESTFTADVLSLVKTKLLEELLSTPLDQIINELSKFAYDTLTLSDNIVNTNSKALKETINNVSLGKMRLSPYDSENYFNIVEEYQPVITIT